MLRLCQGDDLQIRKLAIEALAEQLWLDPAKQEEVAKNQGIETFMAVVTEWKDEDEKVLLPALWALRNVTHDHPPNKDYVGDLKGIDVLLDVCQNHTHFSTGDGE